MGNGASCGSKASTRSTEEPSPIQHTTEQPSNNTNQQVEGKTQPKIVAKYQDENSTSTSTRSEISVTPTPVNIIFAEDDVSLNGFVIPKDVIIEILAFCNIQTYLRLQSVSKNFHAISNSAEAVRSILKARKLETTKAVSQQDIKKYCFPDLLRVPVTEVQVLSVFEKLALTSELFGVRFIRDDPVYFEHDLLDYDSVVKESMQEEDDDGLNYVESLSDSRPKQITVPTVAQFGFEFPQQKMQFLIHNDSKCLFLLIRGKDESSFKLYTVHSSHDPTNGYFSVHAKHTASSTPGVQLDTEDLDITSIIHSKLLLYYRDGLLSNGNTFFSICKALYSLFFLEPFYNGCVNKHFHGGVPGFWLFGRRKEPSKPATHDSASPDVDAPSFTAEFQRECILGYSNYTYEDVSGLHLRQVNATASLSLNTDGFAFTATRSTLSGTDRNPEYS